MRYVFFAEDDCRFRAHFRAAHLMNAASKARNRVAWLGCGRRRGSPKVGAHLVSVNRAALAAFDEHARKVLGSRSLALDILLNRLWRQGLVYVPTVTL